MIRCDQNKQTPYNQNCIPAVDEKSLKFRWKQKDDNCIHVMDDPRRDCVSRDKSTLYFCILYCRHSLYYWAKHFDSGPVFHIGVIKNIGFLDPVQRIVLAKSRTMDAGIIDEAWRNVHLAHAYN